MFSAGAVSAVLSGNFNPAGFMAFDAAMKKSGATMAASEKKMVGATSRMNRGMAVAGKAGAFALAGGVLAAGVAIGKSVKLAADFEEQLSRLKATTGASAQQMQSFKKDALAAGAATKFSALDAAKAQVELAKGGLAVKDMAGGLKASLALAAAGELDLALAGETVVNAMKQFGLEGAEASHIADALATAANSTTVDVTDLAMALRQGGGVAAMAGASFDETVAAVSALADASVRGSDAGTSLKSFFLNIATPSKQAAAAMKGLGMNIFDTQGNLKPLPALAANVRQAFGDLTKEQFLNKAGVIAGSDAARALFAIYKAGPEGMARYLDAQKEVGTAAETAATKQDNLRGKVENLMGSLETAGIQFGEGLLPGLTEGAEKLTETINEMAASGQLEQLGRDLGEVVSGLVEAGPAIAASMKVGMAAVGPAVKSAQLVLIGLLTPIGGIAKALLGLGKAFNAVSGAVGGPKIDLGELEAASNRIDGIIDSMAKDLVGLEKKSPTVRIKGDASQAQAALKKVQGMGLSEKVMKILGKDISAAAKIKQLRAMGIDPKTARILGQNADAIAKIGSVQGALNSLPNPKTINVNVITTSTKVIGETVGRALSKAKDRAKGRGPDGAERALVGEGRGPELHVDGLGRMQVVSEPTIMDLGAGDYVIPFGDPGMKGRALGLMLDMFGIKGYKRGRKPKKKGGRGRSARPLPIPDAVRFGAVPEDELNASRDKARESYQKRKERIRDLDVDIREQRRKVGGAKGKEKSKARAKLRDLQDDRDRYLKGPGRMSSLADLKRQFESLQRQATQLRRYNREIDRLNTMQETERAKMAVAAKRGDAGGWGTARRRRGDILEDLRDRYAKAVKLAKPGSNFQAELEGRLAGVESEIADVSGEAFEAVLSPAQQAAQDVADRLADTGMTDAERAHLEGLEATQSLAALSAPLDDDQAAAVAIERFLSGVLGAAQADPRRGGASAIRDIADRVRQARDNVASFAGGATNDNADIAAQLEQRTEELRVARRESEINARSLSTFRGAGDIGMGGPRVVQNFSMLVAPTDPAQLRQVGDAAVGGMALQGAVRSTRTTVL